MRHRKSNNNLSRTSAHRSAMMANMATSLIMHKRIFTTEAKAKELRKYVEPIITTSKEDTTNARRQAFSKLQNKQAVTELFQVVSQKVGDRPGGYTRILKTGTRLGDNASMCFIELVDFNENMLSETTTKKTRTRRSRRKSRSADAVESQATATSVNENKEAKSEGQDSAKVEEVKDEVSAPEVEDAKEEVVKDEATEEVKTDSEKEEK
jgi:large subunit ribosomal protein L17